MTDTTQDSSFTDAALDALGAINAQVAMMLVADTPLDDWVDMIVALDQIKSTLRLITDDAHAATVLTMGRLPQATSRSGVVVERKVGQPRKTWDHHGIADLVARRIEAKAIDMDTGEVVMSTTDQIKELLTYAGVSYWKVSALKEINVDPAKYCETKDPLTTLNFHYPQENPS